MTTAESTAFNADACLEAYLNGDNTVKVPVTAERDDAISWEPPEGPEITVAPKSGKLSKRTWFAIIAIFVLIPLTIWLGLTFFGDRKYYFISMAIVIYTILPFVMVFEGRKPKARELMVLAVMSGIAVAGRAAFFMLPQFKPVTAIVIITAVCFGAESGFLVGALSGFVSNFFMGQGPWTPYQMFAWGIIGFLAGILFTKGKLKATRTSLCVYGFLSTFFIYGFIMNTASPLMFYQGTMTLEMFIPYYVTGAPFDLIHALSTVFFLLIAAKPMIEKLERIKVKYGLIESKKD
ncbi:MAG: ECF transporter S component [Eubacteriaceae bacterium]|nr:ECF transporter S component [Eubacteriaceae bacterium]